MEVSVRRIQSEDIMIEIGYEILPIDRELSPLWRKSPAPDLSTVSAMDLAYQYFLSRVDFVIAGENIGRRWGSLPLLDFTASVKFLCNSIKESGEGSIDFTENDHSVRFVCHEDLVHVEDSWASGVLACDREELLTAATCFIDGVLRDLSAEHPAIRSNAFFIQLGERSS
ncbi:hypothetical protein E1258_30680 [Micromonospora sp. KC207]|uniref:hypothetical protein n=1 Tax=Micromonospora sp. KC207 TaxID=2530377 RepID=UPI0010F013C6|nr:hypothetical protein [Micromonospora sp. KC207]TDC45151.1 hypothetical protein E1258_30680 [Micromonospora sp. KC207]